MHLCETSPTPSTSSSAPAVQPGCKQGSVHLCSYAYASLFCVYMCWHACMQCCIHMYAHTTHSLTPNITKALTSKAPTIHEVANSACQGLVELVHPFMRVGQP